MYIPDEIVSDIVFQLPAKSIARFRCVSKQWSSMLSTPQFINTHLSNHKNDSLLLISNSGSLYSLNFRNAHQVFDGMPVPAKKLSFGEHPDTWVAILASYNGLVLVEDKQENMFLINPTTRDIVTVPDLPIERLWGGCYTNFGIGYDSVSEDYKIVAIYYFDPEIAYDSDLEDLEGSVCVYSVRNGSWVEIEKSPYTHGHTARTQGVFLKGEMHWVAQMDPDDFPEIMSVDLVEGKFWEVPFLAADMDPSRLHKLLLLDGCLCLPVKSDTEGTDVWVMKEYGNKESWTKFTITQLEDYLSAKLFYLRDELLILVLDQRGDQLVMYDMKRETYKDIVVHGIPDGFWLGPDGDAEEKSNYRVSTFVESLISPH